MYTTHGHYIPGTSDKHERPDKVVRCGGPSLCAVCAREAAQAIAKLDTEPDQPKPDFSGYITVEGMKTGDQRETKTPEFARVRVVLTGHNSTVSFSEGKIVIELDASVNSEPPILTFDILN